MSNATTKIRATDEEMRAYKERCALLVSGMNSPSWLEFEKLLQGQKDMILARMARAEVDIDVKAVEKKGDEVTIVVVNKDYNKHFVEFINWLQNSFSEWRMECVPVKPEEGKNV